MNQWFPQPGPQLAALEADWCDELFYGGERGGGKSDLQLGYQDDGAARWQENWRGVMFRKTYPELEELQSRAMQVFGASGATFKTQPSADYPYSNSWYWPNGATVKMRYIENEKDYGRYHGHQYCVGVNTRIWMADGSLLCIKDIVPGDMVATLEGPRRVIATVKPYVAPCVKLHLPYGSQLQPVWHPVLTSVDGISELRPDASQAGERLPPWVAAQSEPCIDRNTLVVGAFAEDGQSYSEASVDGRQASLPPLRSSVPVMLAAQLYHLAADRIATQQNAHDKQRELCGGKHPLRSSWLQRGLALLSGWFGLSRGRVSGAFPYVHAACGGVETPSIRGFLGGYLSYFHSCDEQSRSALEACRDYALSQAYVASLDHGAMLSDGKGYIPEYSPQALYRYIHPYTKEQRQGSLPLELGTAQIELVGDALVCDLTIGGVNHYISEIGIINKNTGISFDEVTEYSTPDGLLKMLSTLRSAAGVPCTVRLTGNPGGVGHIWVKARYIDIGPPLTPYVDPETGFTRMFVPSRMQDNAILLTNDPGYKNRIMAATGGNEALRKAWLEGDWDIVAGAFFECWNVKRHVVKPFQIPHHWTRIRSMDWGSAAPFSVGWTAIVSEPYQLPDGRILPRGCMVRYREWYGAEKPNVGLKLTAEEVGAGIASREVGEKMNDEVLDPAAFAQDGGPSIAERVYAGSGKKVNFRRADNTRTSKSRGAMGGWDLVRARLIGDGDGNPMWVTFDTNRDTIRTLPLMQHDKLNIEDLDTKMEDHAVDEIRYGCASRPWTAPTVVDTPIRGASEMTMREAWRKAKPKSQSGGRI